MPENVTFLPKDALLSFEEIAHFVRVAVSLGITKVRLTGGGTSASRRDLPSLVEMLVAIPGLQDLGLTTNGLLLACRAGTLRRAGLQRLNVSLDTLDADRFRELSRRDGLVQVLDGFGGCSPAAGFEADQGKRRRDSRTPETDVIPLASYCRENGFDLRFIEYMPIGADVWEREKVLAGPLDILDELASEVRRLCH